VITEAIEGQLSIQQLLTCRTDNSGGQTGTALYPADAALQTSKRQFWRPSSNACTILILTGPSCQTWTALYPEAADLQTTQETILEATSDDR
jgi:hypothetical protein